MKAVLSSYHSDGWGDAFVVAIILIAVFCVQMEDLGYWSLFKNSIRVVRSHYRVKRKMQKELRQRLHLQYIRERKKLQKRQIRRMKHRLYVLWKPYADQQGMLSTNHSGRESA